MIITIEEFNQYSGNHEDSTEAVAMKENIINASEETVIAYLRYNPIAHEQEDTLSGCGYIDLPVHAYPINSIISVSINGESIPLESISADKECLFRNDGSAWPVGINNIKVRYTCGFDQEDVPASIKQAVLEIASLKLAESNGNIGLSGKSFADASKSFISYTNYQKYLSRIDNFRAIYL